MQTGIISFCGRNTGINIKSSDTKRLLTDKLETYGINILKRHFDKFTPDTERRVKQVKHLISLKSNGNPYLLFLTRFNGVDTAMYVDKKIQHGYFLPRIIIDRLSFKTTLFEDTIIDGEMVKISDDKWLFLMNDLFVYRSKRMVKYSLIERLNKLHRLLESKYFAVPNQKYAIQIKRYFHSMDDALALKDELEYTSRGIQYKPLTGRFRYVLKNFDDSLITDVKRVKYSSTNKFLESALDDDVHVVEEYDINCKRPPLVEKEAGLKIGAASHASHTLTDTVTDAVTRESNLKTLKTFQLQKTDQPDVYKLFEGDSEIGIASVSTMKTSKMLKRAFTDVNLNEKKVFQCEFSERFKKWVPVMLKP